MSEIKENNELIDKLGICASTLCLVHCVLTGILIIGLPFINVDFLNHHLIHDIFAAIVVVTVLIAVYPHCRRHGHKDIILIALMGVGFVLAGAILHDIPEWASHTLTSFGSLFLITAHYRNIKVRHGTCHH
ncbi:MAG: MerC domain-containing protein [Bdellovibrionota bacterium]|nr:MerC domain-containing protein [Bdellovibrionota bacterium]